MKTGDKLLCIKSTYYKDYKNDTYTYIKNNYYKILYIGELEINIKCEEGNYISFWINKQTLNVSKADTYEDYFIPIKESRKLKLQKINETT